MADVGGAAGAAGTFRLRGVGEAARDDRGYEVGVGERGGTDGGWWSLGRWGRVRRRGRGWLSKVGCRRRRRRCLRGRIDRLGLCGCGSGGWGGVAGASVGREAAGGGVSTERMTGAGSMSIGVAEGTDAGSVASTERLACSPEADW